jgi:hypothetical protein
MTQVENTPFLSDLLAFLATQRFFPDVSSSEGGFEFSVIDRANVEYFCSGHLSPVDGALTSYEIRRNLCSYANFKHMKSLLHFTRVFSLINQPFAILLDESSQLQLSCAGIHQTNTKFNFEALADLFRNNAARIQTAVERLATQSWSHEEIEGMVYVLSGLIKQEIGDAG